MGYFCLSACLLGSMCLLQAVVVLSQTYSSTVSVTSTTIRSGEQQQNDTAQRYNVENEALVFLKRFTCFSHCQDVQNCLPENVTSAVLKGAGVASLLVDHVLHLRIDCQRTGTMVCDFGAKKCAKLGSPSKETGDVSFNELESVVDYALLHLKSSYQPVRLENCFTAHDLLHDVNDAAGAATTAQGSHEQKVESLKSAMFTRLSAGECIGRLGSVDFINSIFERYLNNGSNSSLSESGLKKLMTDIGIVRRNHDDHDHSHDDHDHDHVDHAHEHIQLQKQNDNKFSYDTSGSSDSNTQIDINLKGHQGSQQFPSTESPLHSHHHDHVHKRNIEEGSEANQSLPTVSNCWDASQLFNNFDMDGTGDIDAYEFSSLCPALIQQRLHGSCIEKHSLKRRNVAEIYGYGTLSVLIISLCSVLGVILMPIQNSSFYEYLMMCFIALAFGTLTGDALLHLIPESVGLHDHSEEGHDHHHDEHEGLPPYFWKLFVLLASVYGLFVFEGLAALAVNGIHGNGEKGGSHGHSHIPSIDLVQMTRKDKSVSSETLESRVTNPSSANGNVPETEHHASVSAEKPHMCCGMTTLALVIIVGDAIHNVADGLTIGAAFNSDIKGGISSALAIFFHELPHEFGDFVILLSCGFTFKKALIWNFIASLTAFIGLYVGIEVGENEEARQWILTVAAGMFLYIALGDMLPELKNQKAKNGLIAFFVQNIGVIAGMTFMILMSVYEDQIKV